MQPVHPINLPSLIQCQITASSELR